jgi:hypothetical protein
LDELKKIGLKNSREGQKNHPQGIRVEQTFIMSCRELNNTRWKERSTYADERVIR